MFSRIVQILLILTSLFFLGGLIYLFIFAKPEHFVLELLETQIDFRLIGMGFCLILIFQNMILFTLLRLDILKRYSLKFNVDSQALFATEKEIPVTVQIKQDVQVPIDEVLDINVPVKQNAEVMICDTLEVPLDIHISVPIDEEMDVHATVPIETVIHLDTKMETKVLGNVVKIPIKMDVPLAMEIPIACKVHVQKDDFTVHIQDQLTISLKDKLPVFMDTTFETRFPLKKTFTVPLQMVARSFVKMDQSEPVQLKGEFILSKDSLKMAVVSGKS